MKNYKATDHAKLSNKELQNEFTKFMLNEYNGYVNNGDSTEQTALVIEPEKATFQAHHDGDFDWFVSEFFQAYFKEKTPAQKIRSDIHKNAYKMDVQEVIELQEKLTEVLNLKLKGMEEVRFCDAEKAMKYADEKVFKTWHKAAVKAMA